MFHMKEQDKIPEEKLSEVEIRNLPKNEFRVMTINTIKEIRKTCLINMLLNNKWITEEIKEEIKKYLETNENENMTIQTYGMSKRSEQK